jgi:hypothetical protein
VLFRSASEAALRVVPSLRFSDGSYLGTYVQLSELSSVGAWESFSAALTAVVGKAVTATLAQISNLDTATGTFKGLLKNVRIEDGAGNVRYSIWSSGAISGAYDSGGTNQSNYGANNANAFDVYVFDGAGARIASNYRWEFEGA